MLTLLASAEENNLELAEGTETVKEAAESVGQIPGFIKGTLLTHI